MKENPRSISCDLIGACCSAMMQIYQYLLAVLDNGMVLLPGDIADCTDTTAVMLTLYLIQPLVF